MARKNRTTSDTRVWAVYLIVGVLLMAGVAFFSSWRAMRKAEERFCQTLEFVKSQSTSFEKYNDTITAKALRRATVAVHQLAEDPALDLSDPRIPQSVEVLSIENRSVQYAMLACGYVDGIAAHETGILQYMKDNAVDFRILEEPLLVTGLGIAFAKNDTRGLDSQLTDTLAQMRADGTLERIIGRYLENAAQYLEVDTIGA